MEDNLNFLKRKTTSFFLKMEDDLTKKMEPKTIKSENNNILENGRQPQFLHKGRQPQKNATKNT
jgi:hypothetical protein